MVLKNQKIRTGIIMSIATLGAILSITSCSKDNSVAPGNTAAATSPSIAATAGATINVSASSATTYTASGPIVLKSNTTISGLSIDLGKASKVGITGKGVSNVHITNCRIVNTTSFAVDLNKCSNITIDNCFISNVGSGVYTENGCTGIKVNSNQFLNINGVNTNILGHAIQFNQTTGGGNQINNNRIENIAGVAQHPHDIINLYHSSGIKGDSIQVIGNWIRGGQLSYYPTANAGACGIVLGDEYGSYQVARNNVLVNPGAGGVANIANQGSSVGIKIDHNKIFSVKTPVSGQGLGVLNSSKTDVGYNLVNWTNSSGGNTVNSTPYSQYYIANSPTPLNWTKNVWADRSIVASVLPATIITMK